MSSQQKSSQTAKAEQVAVSAVETTNRGRQRLRPAVYFTLLLGAPVAALGLVYLAHVSTATAQTGGRNGRVAPAQLQANKGLEMVQHDSHVNPAIVRPGAVSEAGQMRSRYPEQVPAFETSYREQKYQVRVQKKDSSGQSYWGTEQYVRKVPVLTQRWGAPTSMGHDPKVLELANELRIGLSDATDEVRNKKLAKLREFLIAEFAERHEQQAREIESAAKRLESLRKLHQHRGKSSADIVQRRIDQLTGASNPLDWNTRTPSIAETSVAPGPSDLDPSLSPQPQGEDSGGGDLPLGPPSNVTNRSIELDRQSQIQTQTADVRAGNQAPGNAETLRSVAGSSIADIFEIVEKASQASSNVREAQLKLSNCKQAYEEGLAPELELQQSQFEYARAQRNVKLHSMQLAAMRLSLQRAIEYATDRLSSNAKQLRSVQDSPNDRGLLSSIQNAVTRAEFEARRAKEALDQFERAVKLVPASDLDIDEVRKESNRESLLLDANNIKRDDSLAVEANEESDELAAPTPEDSTSPPAKPTQR
ncbi:hypothetical protein [Planctomycetes bacterium K23_9]|uniref:Uncharacterized protein n=1 Tax=Stieleria marina TaxID=1930275 RepID=A0A517NYM7_9BACT|nr:hypothetical protein K239x_42240 [Planctomycetes bacterium K23_9]